MVLVRVNFQKIKHVKASITAVMPPYGPLTASVSSSAAGMRTASVAGCGSSRTGERKHDWAAARMCLDPLSVVLRPTLYFFMATTS